VALALAEHPSVEAVRDNAAAVMKNSEATLLKKRSKAARNTAQGAILLSMTILIGVALALFSHKPDWMVIWTIFFGWMACWGVVLLAFGIGGILETKMMSRPIGHTAIGTGPTESLGLATDPLAVPVAASPVSITEHTTERLHDHRNARVDDNK